MNGSFCKMVAGMDLSLGHWMKLPGSWFLRMKNETRDTWLETEIEMVYWGGEDMGIG